MESGVAIHGPVAQDEAMTEAFRDAEQRYNFRSWQARWVFGGLFFWLFIVLAILALQGLELVEYGDPVLIALIVSWPGAMAAYLYRMARYVFPIQSGLTARQLRQLTQVLDNSDAVS